MWYDYEWDGRHVWQITYDRHGNVVDERILPYAIPEDYGL